jgi:hypothetical protein
MGGKRPADKSANYPEFFPPLTFANAFPRSIGGRHGVEKMRHLIYRQALCLLMSRNVNIVVATKPRYILRGNAGV